MKVIDEFIKKESSAGILLIMKNTMKVDNIDCIDVGKFPMVCAL